MRRAIVSNDLIDPAISYLNGGALPHQFEHFEAAEEWPDQ